MRSFSCRNLLHNFEFEIRISDQIQTVKMAVGRHLKFHLNITNSLWEIIPYTGKNNGARMRSLKSELAKLTDSIAFQVTETHAPCSHIMICTGTQPLQPGPGRASIKSKGAVRKAPGPGSSFKKYTTRPSPLASPGPI